MQQIKNQFIGRRGETASGTKELLSDKGRQQLLQLGGIVAKTGPSIVLIVSDNDETGLESARSLKEGMDAIHSTKVTHHTFQQVDWRLAEKLENGEPYDDTAIAIEHHARCENVDTIIWLPQSEKLHLLLGPLSQKSPGEMMALARDIGTVGKNHYLHIDAQNQITKNTFEKD